MLGVSSQHKNRYVPIFKTFKTRVKLEFEKKIKCLKINNGRIVMNFDKFYK